MLPAAPLAEVTAPLSEGLRAYALAVGDLVPNVGDQPFSVYAVVTAPGAWLALQL